MAEGFTTNNDRSLLKQVHIGDLVELLGNERFFRCFKTKDLSESERYAGYVVLVDKSVIGLSPSHPNNRFHGYVGGKSDQEHQEQKVTLIEVKYIAEYRIASATDKD